jgi:hypothetical protein
MGLYVSLLKKAKPNFKFVQPKRGTFERDMELSMPPSACVAWAGRESQDPPTRSLFYKLILLMIQYKWRGMYRINYQGASNSVERGICSSYLKPLRGGYRKPRTANSPWTQYNFNRSLYKLQTLFLAVKVNASVANERQNSDNILVVCVVVAAGHRDDLPPRAVGVAIFHQYHSVSWGKG